MRRILLIGLVILIVISGVTMNGCVSRKEVNNLFDSFRAETDAIPYMRYDTLVLGKETLDFNALLKANNINGSFHEVYVIKDNVVFFGYAESERTPNGGKLWHIASVTVDGKDFSSVYSSAFCEQTESDQTYVKQVNDHSENRYLSANGFYDNEKIVLTDHVKLVEFDLRTQSATEFSAKSYTYPSMPVVEIVDGQSIVFSKNDQQKVFDANQGKQTSVVFEKMLALKEEKNWDKKSLLSGMFDTVQIVGDKAFIICRVMNWHSETHAVVFQYDFETNGCKYAFHCFMDDLIRNNLYVVPMIP